MDNNSKKILIVDDEPAMREAGARMLQRRLRAHISTCDNGQDAIAFTKSNPFDLILLDLSIPIRNGWEVIEEIRKFNMDVLIYVVTGKPQFSSEEQLIINSKTSGAYHKPVKIEILVERIAELLGQEIAIDPVCIKAEELRGRPEAREIVHSLNGIHGSIRICCEEYFYLLEHGLFDNKSERDRIEYMTMILRDTMDNIKLASHVVERIRKL